MKAKYQTPSIETISSDLCDLIMASGVEEGFNTSTAPTTEETSGNLSRRDIWNDEEEDF